MANITEAAFEIRHLLDEITEAFADAAAALRDDFAEGGPYAGSPFVYHMPRMTCEIRLSLSYSEGKVTGMFSRSSSDHEQELVSTIKIDVVAMPKSALKAKENEG